MTEFISLLSRRLRAGGVSVYRLSLATGISRSTICRALAGKSSLSLEKAEKIASALGLSMMQFYDETLIPPEKDFSLKN